MNSIRQGNKRFAKILTNLLYPRSSGGSFYDNNQETSINSKSNFPPLLVEKADVKKPTTLLLDESNNKTFTDLNSKRIMVISDPVYTMDATQNPDIFQLPNQNSEAIGTSKISDVFYSKNLFRQVSTSHKNHKIIYSNAPELNNIIRSIMKLQPMSRKDYEDDLQKLLMLFKCFRNKESAIDDSDLEMFVRMAEDFYEMRYSDQILIPGSSESDEFISLGII